MQKGHSNLLLLISLCGLSALGQQGSEGKPLVPNGGTSEVRQTQESGTPLTNADIVGMLKAGTRESEIIAAIRANPTKLDLSADALIALRKAGLNNKILEAMVERGKTEMNAQNTCRLVGATQGKEDARSHDTADREIYSSFVEDRVAVSLQKTALGQYEMSPQSALLPGEFA
jgi:hypothetical protein